MPFQDLDHLAVGHVGRAVEGHVLEEVGQALLGVGLFERARADAQAQGGLSRRGGVMHHHIAQAVRQGPKAHGRVGRKVLGVVLGPDLFRRACRDRPKRGGLGALSGQRNRHMRQRQPLAPDAGAARQTKADGGQDGQAERTKHAKTSTDARATSRDHRRRLRPGQGGIADAAGHNATEPQRDRRRVVMNRRGRRASRRGAARPRL